MSTHVALTGLARDMQRRADSGKPIRIGLVGSGEMATQLTNIVALQLLIDAISAVLMLIVIISLFKDVSGAHFNPVITGYLLIKNKIKINEAILFILTQLLGAISGSVLANLMFNLPIFGVSQTSRDGTGLFIGEIIATFGLVLIVGLGVKKPEHIIPAWIGSAYFFTSSTSFANPAVTIGRIFTDSFAGIAANSVVLFITAQIVGMSMAYLLIQKLSIEAALQLFRL